MFIQTITRVKNSNNSWPIPGNNQTAFFNALKSANGLISCNTNTVNNSTYVITRTWNSVQDFQNFFSNSINQTLYFQSTFDRISQELTLTVSDTIQYSSN